MVMDVGKRPEGYLRKECSDHRSTYDDKLINHYTKRIEPDHVRNRVTERHQAVSDAHGSGLYCATGPQPQRRAWRVLCSGRSHRLWQIHHSESHLWPGATECR